MNILTSLLDYGQSYWLDNLTRNKIVNGELTKRVHEQGLRGITTNPSIFYQAITDRTDYNEQIAELVSDGKNPEQIYDALTIKDVQDACDILYPVYTKSAGVDGFVSLEVSPHLSRNTQGTIKEARKLHYAVGRPNCLIKIPGTIEGIPAIEQMLYEGININITLIFSIERYIEVAQAYIRAIERRITEGKSVNNVISVASIFISRIDTLTDQLLGHYIVPFKENQETVRPELLFGQAGIATAQIAYTYFSEIFNSPLWKGLQNKGAHIQRPLWASTSNKDPLYSDLRYVETLIGKNTINTIPDITIAALADHGVLKTDSIIEGLDKAKQLFVDLKVLGIDMSLVTQQLENEGIQKFTDAYNKLITKLADKRLELLGKQASPQQISFGSLTSEVTTAYSSIDQRQIGKLLFTKDPHLWGTDKEQTKGIKHSLGWLALPDHFTKNAEDIVDFAMAIKEEGYTHVVLLGMGGSSLCSEVARETFGTTKGFLQLLILDNTDPAAIIELETKITIDKTLFIVASKSGNTEETLSFFRYFYHILEKRNNKKTGDSFVAITDEGSPLVAIAEQFKFRKVFMNPPNLGGRYSVLSDFGLVPMALIGINIKALLTSAKQMENSCNNVPAAINPGFSLGVFLGICQRHGLDKVTFVLSSSISSFGYWLEQLLAESTGKEGKGLIPINGESLGDPSVYEADRVFVHMYLRNDNNTANEEKIENLEKAGHPVVRIEIANEIALGGEYYRWEIAVAVAAIIIGINPFNQPNVEESKKNTSQLLEEWSKNNSFKKDRAFLKIDDISIYTGKIADGKLDINPYESLGQLIKAFTELAMPNNYIALLPYFLMTDYRTDVIQIWRQQLRDELKTSTTLLNGPRYLHSTGQLHKGGPNTGLFILLTGNQPADLAIPGEKFSFSILHHAQALGDFQSLDDKERRVIRIDLGKNIDASLKALSESIKAANKGHFQHVLA